MREMVDSGVVSEEGVWVWNVAGEEIEGGRRVGGGGGEFGGGKRENAR